MKHLTLTACILMLFNFAQAKKVKFAVDMSGIVVNTNGIHVSGDFQIAAGYSANWDAAATLLSQESDTNIYSIVVDIPAFHKYEYKFVNGDQFYEVEFVPEESRVGYDFNDNRWMYVDSLSDDTTFIGVIRFAKNAPDGKNMIRFKVNMKNQSSISSNGVHVAGSHQSWNLASTRLYSFVDSVYELISFVDSGTYQFKFFNGNTISNSETVPSSCANNGNRTVTTNGDIVLDPVCYSSCSVCYPTAVETVKINTVTIYPNPSKGIINIALKQSVKDIQISLVDLTGRLLLSKRFSNVNSATLDANGLASNIYFIRIIDFNNPKNNQVQQISIIN